MQVQPGFKWPFDSRSTAANPKRDEPKQGYWTVQDDRSRRNQREPRTGRWVAPNTERRGFHGMGAISGRDRGIFDASDKSRQSPHAAAPGTPRVTIPLRELRMEDINQGASLNLDATLRSMIPPSLWQDLQESGLLEESIKRRHALLDATRVSEFLEYALESLPTLAQRALYDRVRDHLLDLLMRGRVFRYDDDSPPREEKYWHLLDPFPKLIDRIPTYSDNKGLSIQMTDLSSNRISHGSVLRLASRDGNIRNLEITEERHELRQIKFGPFAGTSGSGYSYHPMNERGSFRAPSVFLPPSLMRDSPWNDDKPYGDQEILYEFLERATTHAAKAQRDPEAFLAAVRANVRDGLTLEIRKHAAYPETEFHKDVWGNPTAATIVVPESMAVRAIDQTVSTKGRYEDIALLHVFMSEVLHLAQPHNQDDAQIEVESLGYLIGYAGITAIWEMYTQSPLTSVVSLATRRAIGPVQPICEFAKAIGELFVAFSKKVGGIEDVPPLEQAKHYGVHVVPLSSEIGGILRRLWVEGGALAQEGRVPILLSPQGEEMPRRTYPAAAPTNLTRRGFLKILTLTAPVAANIILEPPGPPVELPGNPWSKLFSVRLDRSELPYFKEQDFLRFAVSDTGSGWDVLAFDRAGHQLGPADVPQANYSQRIIEPNTGATIGFYNSYMQAEFTIYDRYGDRAITAVFGPTGRGGRLLAGVPLRYRHWKREENGPLPIFEVLSTDPDGAALRVRFIGSLETHPDRPTTLNDANGRPIANLAVAGGLYSRSGQSQAFRLVGLSDLYSLSNRLFHGPANTQNLEELAKLRVEFHSDTSEGRRLRLLIEHRWIEMQMLVGRYPPLKIDPLRAANLARWLNSSSLDQLNANRPEINRQLWEAMGQAHPWYRIASEAIRNLGWQDDRDLLEHALLEFRVLWNGIAVRADEPRYQLGDPIDSFGRQRWVNLLTYNSLTTAWGRRSGSPQFWPVGIPQVGR
ncbi:MAG: hypothetical protein A2992_02845 [Elusimicrobia bacterium RIFCSPLOWO2_01_FULL_59_12]|nr:MAG: hypothetical protein A2992_02845 [Elusimicrobia bacterium RIFCSPLOWO2_01_FULL_59_12]